MMTVYSGLSVASVVLLFSNRVLDLLLEGFYAKLNPSSWIFKRIREFPVRISIRGRAYCSRFFEVIETTLFFQSMISLWICQVRKHKRLLKIMRGKCRSNLYFRWQWSYINLCALPRVYDAIKFSCRRMLKISITIPPKWVTGSKEKVKMQLLWIFISKSMHNMCWKRKKVDLTLTDGAQNSLEFSFSLKYLQLSHNV